MKWIGQHIYDQISRFRNDVYLEDIPASTETDMLVVDSSGKVSKRAIDAITVDVSDFMTNGVDNRVLTATGADAINAEANLTFDGSTLTLAGDQTITNTVVDQIALDINASNTTGNIIDINAQALTTGSAIYIDCNSLGSSPTIHLDVDDAGTTTASRILHWIDYDKSSNTPNTIANSVTGSAVYLNDNATGNHVGSTHILTGHDSQIGVLNANGTQVISGHKSIITNGTTFGTPSGIRSYFSGITNGYGVDFQSVSSANTADYFTIDTTTNGATTLTTVDADAALAHFEIAADGNITLDAAGDIVLEAGSGVFSCDAAAVDFTGASANRPSVNLTNNANDATGPNILLRNMRDGSGLEDDDVLGTISFAGEDAAGATETYGSITGSVVEADHGDEAGQIAITVANDGTERNGITMTADKGTATEVDVTIANGAASTTTIAGTLTMGSTATIDNSGAWVGGVIPSAKLDADTMHLSVAQTITNTKTFSTDKKLQFRDSNAYINSPTANDLEIAATVVTLDSADSIQLETPQVTLNGGSGQANLSLYSTGQMPHITLQNAQSGIDGRDLGQITFSGNDDGGAPTSQCRILAETSDATDGQEAGRLSLKVTEFDGTLTTGLMLEGDTNANGEIDVTIAAGAASTTTIAGTLTMGSTAFVNNSGVVQVATQGTIDHDSLANFVAAEHVDWAGASAGTIHSTNIPTLNQSTTGTAATVTEAAQTSITSLGTLTGLTTSGAIELGHASDTTLARSAAGVVTIEGNQIVTEGTADVSSGAQAPVAMMVARRTITTAEANALHTTPIELIPAQGSNTIIQVVNAQFRIDRAASQSNASCDANLHYAGQEPGQVGVTSLAHVRRFAYLYSTDSVILAVPPGAQQAQSLSESVNQGVEVSFDSASTNNCFSSIDVFVNYYVFFK